MQAFSSARSTLGVLVVILAVLFASLTSGLHSRGDAVGQAAVEPTTIYYSEHSGDTDEEHLHAETGFELNFCLACFLSLQHRTVLKSSPLEFALTQLGEHPPEGFSSAPLAPRGRIFSSRAPPRA